MSWEIRTVVDYWENDYKRYEFVKRSVSFFILKNLRIPGASRKWIDNDVLFVELFGARFNKTDILLEELTSRQESRYRVYAWYPPGRNTDIGLAEKLLEVVKESERQYIESIKMEQLPFEERR